MLTFTVAATEAAPSASLWRAVKPVRAAEGHSQFDGHSPPVAAALLAGTALLASPRTARRRGRRAPVSATKGDEIKFASKSSGEAAALPTLPLQQRAQGIAEALPALARLSGSIVVIKYGGAAMVESPERTIRDVATLAAMGLKPVLVHGGGPEINSWLAKVGIEPKFVRGLRVTDAETMEVVAMVLMGKVNKGIVATMGAAGVAAVGLSGVDGGLLEAKKVDDEELGFVGEVTGVRGDVLLSALEEGLVPVVATVAADAEGNFLNVNADLAAAAIARALEADEFVLMTDVPGILRDVKDPDSLISEVDETGAEKLIEDGVVAGGMIPKVTCCLSAIKDGVQATHIIDGRRPHALLEELFSTGAGKQGTTIRQN
ncbi:Acetylglutamate kinase (N-acetyl-L-glutamate 5-phosphotransferase) (NAG kinase) (NAGK) [Durusdinium trenchii]